MDTIKTFFTYQWQRKILALLTAIVIWFFVDHSITDSTTITNVPIRVINIPEDKTIPNMQPNGIISKRIALTLTGTKNVIDQLEPGDIEVVLDASSIQQNDWVVQILKKNLLSLNPSIDLSRHISEVTYPEFVLKFSKVTTAKIPVKVVTPKNNPPQGYEYLDIWPQQLFHVVVGPEEQVQELLKAGLELEIDMNMISKSELDKIKTSRENFHDDEVSFFIPEHWKKIVLPIKNGITEDINDPEAQNLHIDFLRREYLPIKRDVAIRAFYPLETAAKFNPVKTPLIIDGKLKKSNDVTFLSVPLFARDVSRLFLEVVEDNLEIIIIAEEKSDLAALHWSLQVVDPHILEDTYVNTLISHNAGGTLKSNEPRHTKKRENHLRMRFREYLQKLVLYTAPDKKLQLDARVTNDGISVIPTTL